MAQAARGEAEQPILGWNAPFATLQRIDYILQSMRGAAVDVGRRHKLSDYLAWWSWMDELFKELDALLTETERTEMDAQLLATRLMWQHTETEARGGRRPAVGQLWRDMRELDRRLRRSAHLHGLTFPRQREGGGRDMSAGAAPEVWE